MAPLYQMPNALAFVATVDGKPVSLWHWHRHPGASVSLLCAVLAHLARLSWTRIADSSAAGSHGRAHGRTGCANTRSSLLRVGLRPSGMRRDLGFRVAYSKVTVIRETGAAAAAGAEADCGARHALAT